MYSTVVYLLIIIGTLLYFYCKRKYSYWSSRGVNVPPDYIPILGHSYKLMMGYIWEYADKNYKDNKQNRFWGTYLFFTPELNVKDPELLREIFVKSADHFIDRRTTRFTTEADEIFNEMLLMLEGEKWKALRSIVTPTFTSGKMKSMFPLIVTEADNLVEECQKKMAKDSYVEMKNMLGFFTMDVIATCAFGFEANCLQNEQSEFTRKTLQLTELSFFRTVKFVLFILMPKVCTSIGLQLSPPSMNYFTDVVYQATKVRLETGMKRGDFLDLMLEALHEYEKNNKTKYPMTMNTVAAQSVLFLVAGFETTAYALAFTMYLLAKNPDCQKRLRDELQEILKQGEFSYQNVMDAKYLEGVVSETLRLYPIAHRLERKCTRKYQIPGTDVTLDEEMIVAIPVWSLHHDPEYWEEPWKFKPERFLPENKDQIVPYTYMPFGQGPRNCVAMRFAQMETKIAIAKLCLNFEISMAPGHKEMVLASGPNTLRPDKNGLCLSLKKITTQ